FGIVGMKMRKNLGTRARRFFQRQAHVILPGPVNETARTVGPIRCDEHGYCVDRQLQVALAVGKPSLTLPKSCFSAPTFGNLVSQIFVGSGKLCSALRDPL